MNESYLEKLPGIRDIVDDTEGGAVVLPREHTLILKGAVEVTPRAGAIELNFTGSGEPGEGTGDVVGPAGATANRIAVFADSTGKELADSGVAISTVIRSSGGPAMAADLNMGGNQVANAGDAAAATDLTTLQQVNALIAAAVVGAGGGGGDGFSFTFTTATTDADPGAGLLRFNNSTLASVTQLFVDLADVSGNDITAWLDRLDDSIGSVKGYVRVGSKSAPTKWVLFSLASVTTATGYRKLGVTHVASGGGGLPNTAAADTFLSFEALGLIGQVPTSGLVDGAVTLAKLATAACSQYRAVANAAARTGLPAGERNAGMLVRENDTGKLYVLAADLTTWVLADTTTVDQIISHASADAVGAAITLRKARGTEASPTAVNADDVLAARVAQGHDGSAYYDAGSVDHVADAAGGTSKRTRARARLHDGTALATTEEAVAHRVTTTDATLTVVRSIPLAADSVLRVRYAIVGAQSSSSNRAIRETSVTVRRSGSGDPAIVSVGDSVSLFRDDGTWGSDSEIGHQINTTTDALEIIVKGKAATTIVWRVDVQFGAR